MKRNNSLLSGIRRLLPVVSCVLIACCLFSCKQKVEKPKTAIVAHRGYWNCEAAGYARNSIAALRQAGEAHFEGSEFDVNMTADSVLLVWHDSYIEGKSIEKNPYSEFADVRLANGEPIPVLDSFLLAAVDYPATQLVFELKPHSTPEVEDAAVSLSLKALERYELLDPSRVMFISFSLHACEQLAQLAPGFTVQYLSADVRPSLLKQKGISGVDSHLNVFLNDSTWLEEAESLDMSTNVWTVNEDSLMQVFFEMGIQQLTTDRPDAAREVLSKLNNN